MGEVAPESRGRGLGYNLMLSGACPLLLQGVSVLAHTGFWELDQPLGPSRW